MTLLITLANSEGVHQSSDYRLSSAGRIVQTENGAKQISASGRDWIAQISFTGIAQDGRGYDTRERLRKTLVAARTDATLDEVVAAIVHRGNSALATVQSYDRRLSIVVGAIASGRTRLFLLSNWESPDGSSRSAAWTNTGGERHRPREAPTSCQRLCEGAAGLGAKAAPSAPDRRGCV